MKMCCAMTAAVLALLAMPFGAQAQGVGEGAREGSHEGAPQQLSGLREKWPVAFPVKDQDVRPLAIGAAREIATAMGWSLPFTLGVLGRWKMASVYCWAVLCHDQRITLDGAPAEPVGAEAKDMAARRCRSSCAAP
jgi:hypothetical protein